MEPEEFKQAFLATYISAGPVVAEALREMQRDCLTSQGVDVWDWMPE